MRHTLLPFPAFRLRVGLCRALPALLLALSLSFPGMGAARPPTPHHARHTDIATVPADLMPALSATLAADAPDVARPFSTAFLPDGLRVTPEGGAPWGMRLTAIGDGIMRLPVPVASPITVSGRVEYQRGDVTEWYVNSPWDWSKGSRWRRLRRMQGRGASC
ncbi:MAG: hypothetical protein ACYDAR_14650 [Thermomicrobiales bacterium]